MSVEKATLINNEGGRVAVEVGSETAKQYLGQGYTLETAGQAPKTGNATFYDPSGVGKRVAAEQGSASALDLVSKGYKPEVNLAPGLADAVSGFGNKGDQPVGDQPTDGEQLADTIDNESLVDFELQGPDKITSPTFDAEKTRLAEVKTQRLQALDEQYSVNLARLQKQNKDVGNSLKARLIKLGVSPSDSAWSNAESGQLERDQTAERTLYSEYMSNKAKIEAEMEDKITNIAMKEADMNFTAQVQNIQNKLTTQAQGINLFQIFSQRDQSEKDREQSAYQFLQNMQYNLMTFDDQKQQAVAKNLLQNAQSGLYNVQDPETMKMLSKMGQESPYLQGLVDVASAGLVDRLDKLALNAANLEYVKSNTAQNYAQINKLRSDAANAGSDADSKAKQAFYDDAKIQLDKLASGKTDWGTAYWTIMNKYEQEKDSANFKKQSDLVDLLLNKDLWSQQGAYEEQSKRRQTADRLTDTLNAINDKLGG